jgi:hypothetical protein
VKLEDLKVYKHPAGFQHKELFENGYGISVIPELDVGEEPLYEVAIYEHTQGKHAHLCYTTAITNDVIRYATVNAVDALIDRIRNLPARTVSI